MSRVVVAVEFDLGLLGGYTDDFLAQLFHVCQANPAEITDRQAIDAADAVKDEIVLRWLRSAPVERFHHQGRHLGLVGLGSVVESVGFGCEGSE